MARIYSVTLFAIDAGAAGTYTSSVVPTGDTWVVRDIVLFNYGHQYSTALLGFSLEDSSGIHIFDVLSGTAHGAVDYRWTGRQVISAEANLSLTTNDDGWTCRVMGYQLTP
jgi:hypothetical protein